MCNDRADALDRARGRCILPQRKMSTRGVIIGGEFRKDPSKVILIDHNQMIGARRPPDHIWRLWSRQRLTDLGQGMWPRDKQTPEALAVQQKAEIEKWWPIIKAANITTAASP